MASNDTSGKLESEDILSDHDTGRITCTICHQYFKDPKYLFCHHLFCERCLEKMQVHSKITCPECNKVTTVPTGGVKELPKSFFVTCMVDNLPKDITENSKCTKALAKPNTVRRCIDHDEELLFYCEPYDQLVCPQCTVARHAGHQHDPLAKKYRQDLEEIDTSLEEIITNVSEHLEGIGSVENEIEQRGDQVCKKIDQYFQEVTDRLMKQREQLKKQVTEIMLQVKDDITPELNSAKKTLEIRKTEVFMVKHMCDNLMKNIPEQEIFAKKSLIDSIPQLICVYKELNVQMVQPAILEFVPTDVSTWPQLGQLCLTDPRKCEVVDLPGFVFKGHKTNITIITKDNSGQCCFEGGSKVNVQLEGGSDSHTIDLQVKDNGDGSHVATILPQQVGEGKLSIFVSGREIKGSPYSVIIRESFTSIKEPSKVINISNDRCEPWGIACDRSDKWAVTDKRNQCVYIYNGKNDQLHKRQYVPSSPVGIAFDEGNMYVVDSANHQVLKFDEHGENSLQFGGNKISNARDIAVHSGRVYVTDKSKRCIVVFTTSGKFHFNVGSGHLRSPRGIAIDVSNQLIFVADSHYECVFTFTLDGLYVRKFGSRGTRVGQLRKPLGLASDSNGTVFVANSKNNCVSIFDKNGTFIHSFGQDQLRAPCAIALNPTGSIYVSDSKNYSIKIFTHY